MIDLVTTFLSDPTLRPKLMIAAEGALVALAFIAGFVALYYRYYWRLPEAKKLFWFTTLALAVILGAKFFIGVFFKGYVPDLLLFYAIPSPKAKGVFWLGAAILTTLLFIRFRERIERLPRQKFLASLFAVALALSISVAAIRDGLSSVADPFTRTFFEYSGNVPLIDQLGLRNFLREYIEIELVPKVADHAKTHPPGYSVVLYLVHRIFGADVLGQALAVVVIGCLALWPVYYLYKEFVPEERARHALQVFVFMPSFIMMTATSTEAIFLTLAWSTMAAAAIGWKRRSTLAAAAGLGAALALFCNFLFLLLVPWFGYLLWRVYSSAVPEDRPRVWPRLLASLLVFTGFWLGMFWWSGYSIVDNFYAARVANAGVVASNFVSASRYLLFVAMNIGSWLFFLGLPFLWFAARTWRGHWPEVSWLPKSGLAVVIGFLLIGIFQGNVERIWLFILPFFPLLAQPLLGTGRDRRVAPYALLMFGQMVVVQVLFYTYF